MYSCSKYVARYYCLILHYVVLYIAVVQCSAFTFCLAYDNRNEDMGDRISALRQECLGDKRKEY